MQRAPPLTPLSPCVHRCLPGCARFLRRPPLLTRGTPLPAWRARPAWLRAGLEPCWGRRTTRRGYYRDLLASSKHCSVATIGVGSCVR
jgi:hypothetical protein